MANGVLIGYDSRIPQWGGSLPGYIVSGTQIFSCHEYRTERDLSMYVCSKATGVYCVSYDTTPDVSGGVDRRWLFYSSSQYLVGIGSDLENRDYYSENADRITNCYWGTIGSQLGVVSNLVYNSNIYNYSTFEEALIGEGIREYNSFPITYRLTNCTASSAPTQAYVGDTVTVPLTFPEGYGVVNPSSDVYVTCNGVLVPSTYTDGQDRKSVV